MEDLENQLESKQKKLIQMENKLNEEKIVKGELEKRMELLETSKRGQVASQVELERMVSQLKLQQQTQEDEMQRLRKQLQQTRQQNKMISFAEKKKSSSSMMMQRSLSGSGKRRSQLKFDQSAMATPLRRSPAAADTTSTWTD